MRFLKHRPLINRGKEFEWHQGVSLLHLWVKNRMCEAEFEGDIMYWLDSGGAYDLSVFCERILNLFAGSGKRAFLMHTEETISR